MASYSKVVTGLTGLNVAKNPTHTLGVLYRYDTDDDDDDADDADDAAADDDDDDDDDG